MLLKGALISYGLWLATLVNYWIDGRGARALSLSRKKATRLFLPPPWFYSTLHPPHPTIFIPYFHSILPTVQKHLHLSNVSNSTPTAMKWAVTVLLLTTCYLKAAGFQLPSATTKSNRSTRLRSTNQDNEQGERQPESKRKQQEETSKFLTDFKTASGNVVDPYKILKVPRSATTVEIKQSYRKLTKKLHPDAVARKEILPGNW